MSKQVKPQVTQRAYTLRLKGISPDDQSWRDALWQTHDAVNKGAKVFGDWLLTLRGGLDHTLADAKVQNKKDKTERDPTDEERKARRILLALSWLSVESKLGAPSKFIVASGVDVASERNAKIVAALEEILKTRGVSEIESWKEDCRASLSAAIREDAVWVNRSNAFDETAQLLGSSLTDEEIWDMLERFFGSREAYLTSIKLSEDNASESDRGKQKEEKAKDLGQKAGQWLSSRFGTGEGADFSRMSIVYREIADWAKSYEPGKSGKDAIASLAESISKSASIPNMSDAVDEADGSCKLSKDLKGVLGLISGPGYKSATRNILAKLDAQSIVGEDDFKKLEEAAVADKEKCESNKGSKGSRPYSDTILKEVESVCGFTYRVDENDKPVSVLNYSKYDDKYKWGSSRHSEFAVILDHAARRVSVAHTWIKRAEAERNQFEIDAKKIKQVPTVARDWLDSFCRERSDISGALEPYRIRKRAVDGWKEVVAAWSKSSCSSSTDRIAAARALQDDPEINKFGDIQLFEALAEDDALCVWHRDGDATSPPDAQPLIDYALASESEFKKRHFKVPAYRHPDALLYPIFCDFGNSRWSIDFSIREACSGAMIKAEESKKRKEAQVEKARTALENAKNKNKDETRAKNKLNIALKELSKIEREIKRLASVHRMQMTLWNGKTVAKQELCWQSKRLASDLAIGSSAKNADVPTVTRADRLGRAASAVGKNEMVNIAGLFEQKDWNGRLQAPRQQLEAIAAVRDNHSLPAQEREQRISDMKDKIRWLVTFSAKLQPQGPWCEFAEKNQLTIDPKYWPHADINKNRKAHSKLILSRLPGLRVLSVDLGHRYAAACAVWEALSVKQVKEACKKYNHKEPDESDLYLHLKSKVAKQKKGKEVEVEKTVIYRRIGSDTLPNGKPHPTPWARLDRQFLIKLQGETDGAREASNEEIWRVHQLEAALGRTAPIIDRLLKSGWGHSDKQKARLDDLRKLGWKPIIGAELPDSADEDDSDVRKPSLSVDELMSSAVRTMRLALKRHGDRARIAHYLITDEKTKPGGIKEKLDNNGRIALLQDVLVIWRDLCPSRGWQDDAAQQLWNQYIVKLSGYQAVEEIAEDATKAEHKKKQKDNRDKLYNAAKTLADDVVLRRTLHEIWKKRWKEDDELWKKQLRWFKDWILPRGKVANDPAIRKVGGLSLTRISTLTEFRRKVQVGFFTRLYPDGTRVETKEKFGQSTLDALEHLREQRVKQLASRIIEAALGVGRVRWTEKDKERPTSRIDEPCHAIVIENLTYYRPEETRTRRENRQLMSWSSSKVQKYLAEACQLYGLHLREVSASYTSRQDSRTGAPGIRCQDVTIKEFMRSPFWQKQVAQANNKKQGDARERLLSKLNAMFRNKSVSDWEKAGVVRLPLKGGEVFVSSDRASPAAKGLQADLNAAANIGLRALIDPDWCGKWWYIPCTPDSSKPIKDKVDGSAAVDPGNMLREPVQAQDTANDKKKPKKKSTSKSKEVINLWRDISSSPINSPGSEKWLEYADYYKRTEERVVNILKETIKDLQLHEQFNMDDIPF